MEWLIIVIAVLNFAFWITFPILMTILYKRGNKNGKK